MLVCVLQITELARKLQDSEKIRKEALQKVEEDMQQQIEKVRQRLIIMVL